MATTDAYNTYNLIKHDNHIHAIINLIDRTLRCECTYFDVCQLVELKDLANLFVGKSTLL